MWWRRRRGEDPAREGARFPSRAEKAGNEDMIILTFLLACDDVIFIINEDT